MRFKRRLLIATALTLAAATAGTVTWAAFTATTASEGSQIQAGNVDISDNDSGGTLLSLTAAVPGNTTTGCIKVTYSGSLPASVRIYGSTGGTGLDQYLSLKVTRGVYNGAEPAFSSCTNFQADATDYLGAGQGVVYDGTLAGFADNYAGGLVDATPGSTETWTSGEIHVYQMEVTLQNNIDGEGLTATQSFTWEARSQ